MPARNRSWLVLAALVVLSSSTVVSAALPWNKLVLFKHLSADPTQEYPIADTNGPWMIMAATFSGDGAEQQAKKLIHELRIGISNCRPTRTRRSLSIRSRCAARD